MLWNDKEFEGELELEEAFVVVVVVVDVEGEIPVVQKMLLKSRTPARKCDCARLCRK